MKEEVFEIGNGQTCNTEIHDVCGTLDCMHDQKALLIRGGEQVNNEAMTFDARGNGDGQTAMTLAGDHQRRITDYTSLAVESKPKTIVRRLTPKECERLQGFPDDYTNIGDWTDTKGKRHKLSDAPRYKALGNSICTPFWEWLAERIVFQLKKDGAENITMASLFDGIGGFPLVFSRKGASPVWASEIEEFPIAVTKFHFPEREERQEE